MIKGEENIIKWLEFNKRNKWKVRRTENGSLVATQDDKELAMIESMLRLRDVFKMLQPGRYFVEGGFGEDKKSWVKEVIELGEPTGYLNGPPTAITSGITSEDVNQAAIEAVEKYKKEEELKILREENLELRKPINQFIGKIEPYAPHIINAIFGAISPRFANKQPIPTNGGINGTHTQESTDNLTDRAQIALEKWYELDNQAIKVLEALPGFIEKNKETYEVLKSQLLKPE